MSSMTAVWRRQANFRRVTSLRFSGVAMLDRRACMAGDPYAAMEHLDDLLCDTHLDDLADQTRGHGVEMPAHLDVIIGSDAGAAPLRVLIRLGRQRQQRRSINALEELAAAGAEFAHEPRIELIDEPADGSIKLGEREEALVAQARQYPALDDQNRDLDLGLVAWPARPRRHNGRAVAARS